MLKYQNKKILHDKYAFIFFLIFFLVGIFITKDYGVSSDEYASRIKGFVTLNYLGEKYAPEINKKYKENKNIPNFKEFEQGRNYGVVFEAPASFIEVILKIKDKKNQFLLRHYLTFLIFFISTIFFYRILKRRFDNNFAILGTIFLILSPRIFANSFYNNKDLVFLSFFIISSFYSLKLIEKPNLKNCLKFSLFAALTIDVRILGILVVFTNFFISIYKNFIEKKIIQSCHIIFLTLVFTIFFTIIFWPYLWESPLNNFISAFSSMAQFEISTKNLFLGKLVDGKQTQWYFLITWIFISTPILYLLLFIFGIISTCKIVIQKRLNLDKQEYFFDLLFLITFFSPLFAVILFNSTLYNGWRQVYFIYPSLIYLSIVGYYFLIALLKPKFYKFLYLIIVTNLFLTFYWMISNHPYQYVYFNNLVPKTNLSQKFDLDYWGLSYKQAFEKILKIEKDNNGIIKIYNLSHNKLFYPLFSIDKKNRNKFKVVRNLDKADYLITNFYLDDKSMNLDLDDEFEVVNEIKVYNQSINTIYKKQAN